MDLVTAILRQVIAEGKGIEVNTSCFRYGLPDLMPSGAILRRYRELGGEIITVGSDSHAPEHISLNVLSVREQLRQMGFRWLATYAQRTPVFHPM